MLENVGKMIKSTISTAILINFSKAARPMSTAFTDFRIYYIWHRGLFILEAFKTYVCLESLFAKNLASFGSWQWGRDRGKEEEMEEMSMRFDWCNSCLWWITVFMTKYSILLWFLNTIFTIHQTHYIRPNHLCSMVTLVYHYRKWKQYRPKIKTAIS